MSVQSLSQNLSPSRDPYAAPRPGDRFRRKPPPEDARAAPSVEAAQPPSVRADLSGPTASEPQTADPLANAHQFLTAFAKLLVSVGAGDVAAARNAATALQLELFAGADAAAAGDIGQQAQTRMLDDLVALIRFARLGELGPTDASAQSLALDIRAALLAQPRARAPFERPPGVTPSQPASLVQGVTAAYELLMDLDATADAA